MNSNINSVMIGGQVVSNPVYTETAKNESQLEFVVQFNTSNVVVVSATGENAKYWSKQGKGSLASGDYVLVEGSLEMDAEGNIQIGQVRDIHQVSTENFTSDSVAN